LVRESLSVTDPGHEICKRFLARCYGAGFWGTVQRIQRVASYEFGQKSAHDFGVVKNIHSDKLACYEEGSSDLSGLTAEGAHESLDRCGMALVESRKGPGWRLNSEAIRLGSDIAPHRYLI
jgi:hypothetical protein